MLELNYLISANALPILYSVFFLSLTKSALYY